MRARSSTAIAIAILSGLAVLGAAREGRTQSEANPSATPQATPQATAEATQPETTQLFVIAPRGGYGAFNETTISQDQSVWSAGLTLRWQPDATSRVVGQGVIGGYTREYVPEGLGQPGSPPRVTEEELRYEGSIHYGYNVLETLGLGGWLYIGWRHIYFTNDQLSYSLSGAMVGAEFEWPVLNDFSILASVDYTYNLVGAASPVDTTGLSVTGQPLASLRFGAGVRANVSDYLQLGLAYQGEHVPYDHTDLLFHQIVIEVGIPIHF